MRAVSRFYIYTNGFDAGCERVRHSHEQPDQGSLPESSLRTMRAVSTFRIYTNGFEGALPESGIQ
eukprot:6351732-Amphidinium_carterae.1